MFSLCDKCKFHDWNILVSRGSVAFIDECPFHPNRVGDEVEQCEDFCGECNDKEKDTRC